MIVILRGASGSGKSTLAKKVKDFFYSEISEFEYSDTIAKDIKKYSSDVSARCEIVSADDFFVDANGIYRFDASKLSEAHSFCKNKFLDLAVNSNNVIVVDNTNTTFKEVNSYCSNLPQDHEIYILEKWCSPEESFNRNLHSVPLHTIKKQMNNLSSSQKQIFNIENVKEIVIVTSD